MSLQDNSFDSWVVRVLSVITAICTIIPTAWNIIRRSPSSPAPAGFPRLSVVLMLGVFTGIGYGVCWQIFDKIFRWNVGAGGHLVLPQGWSALALSLSVTLPLLVVPWMLQRLTSVTLPARHWKAALLVILLGAIAHLLIYGVGPVFVGLRNLLMPPQQLNVTLVRGMIMEVVIAFVYFPLIVLPYRLMVEQHSTFVGTFLGRTILPALAFCSGMSVFIAIQPDSLRDPTWIQVRGIIGGLYMMACFCAGIFV